MARRGIPSAYRGPAGYSYGGMNVALLHRGGAAEEMPLSALASSLLTYAPIGLYLATEGLYSDAGSSPAVDGGTIRQWNNLASGAPHASQATAELRPVWLETGNPRTGGPVVSFVNTYMDIGDLTALIPSGGTLVQVFTPRGTGFTAQEIYSTSNNGSYYKDGSTGIAYSGTLRGTRVDDYPAGLSRSPVSGTRIRTVVSDGSSYQIFTDGTAHAGQAAGFSGGTAHRIGASGDAGRRYVGYMSAIIIFDRVLSTEDREAVEALCRTEFGSTAVDPGTIHTIIGIGDSITQQGVNGQVCWTDALAALSNKINVFNAGVAGDTLLDMNARLTPLDLYTSVPSELAYVFGGTNDIAIEGVTGATAKGRMDDILDDLVAAGHDLVFAVDMLPRGALGTPFDDERISFNTLLRAGFNATAHPRVFSGGAHALVLYRPSLLPEAADPTNTTYYTDGTHPTSALHALMAADILAIETILGIPV